MKNYNNSEIKILYEDENYIGFFKPPNIPTTYKNTKHNNLISSNNCFLDILKKEYNYLFNFDGYNKLEGGLLYRLDNDTSGLLLFAKNINSFKKFIEDKNLKKIYIAKSFLKINNNLFIQSILEKKEINIAFPIAHKSNKKMVAIVNQKKLHYKGKIIQANTYVSLIEVYNDTCILKCLITNGARHQIRVHLSSIGLPIIGDRLYNKDINNIQDDMLQLYCVGISSSWLNIYCDNFVR